MSIDIQKALEIGWPNLGWSAGATYESIEWSEKISGRPKPTKAEIADVWERYKAQRDALAYRDQRKAAILAAWPVHAQLEAITEAASGDSTKMEAMVEAIAEIKRQYPKPGGASAQTI